MTVTLHLDHYEPQKEPKPQDINPNLHNSSHIKTTNSTQLLNSNRKFSRLMIIVFKTDFIEKTKEITLN